MITNAPTPKNFYARNLVSLPRFSCRTPGPPKHRHACVKTGFNGAQNVQSPFAQLQDLLGRKVPTYLPPSFLPACLPT